MDQAKIAIVAVIYSEPDWEQTREALEACKSQFGDCQIHYVERRPQGTGSLAEAINRGFKSLAPSDYVWFLTNIIFAPDLLSRLVAAMEQNPGYAAIHPCFHSDHLFCRPSVLSVLSVVPVPFVEFTAPLVRAGVFAEFPLDATMPYWGHDLDWGYRVWCAGHKVGVLQAETPLIDHTYIRFADGRNPHPVTRRRYSLRRQTNAITRTRLVQKYGPNYHDLIFPKTKQEVEAWFQKQSLSTATAC